MTCLNNWQKNILNHAAAQHQANTANAKRLTQWLEIFEERAWIQLRLEYITAAMKQLSILPWPNHCKVITITGTNGKGSTVTAISSIYIHAGYRVGSYFSPHLIEYNERIQINLSPLSDQTLAAIFTLLDAIPETKDLTYFEMTTLAAFYAFSQAQLDVVVLEVGMGGRLDATNSLDADLAIITTVDFDHQDYLGPTLEDIGYEKTGIFRPNQPCLYADYSPPNSVRQQAIEKHCPFHCLGETYHLTHYPEAVTVDCVNLLYRPQWNLPSLQIHPQAAAAAVIASEILQHQLPVSRDHQLQGIQQTKVAGRQQWLSHNLLVDVAHNPQSVKHLARTIQQLRQTYQRVFAVFSGFKDKDLHAMVLLMKPAIDVWLLTVLNNNRAANETYLRDIFARCEINISQPFYSNPVMALDAALAQASTMDLIIVFGSFDLVGPIMQSRRYK